MRKKIYLVIQHYKFLCIYCPWLYNNAHNIVASFSFPRLCSAMQKDMNVALPFLFQAQKSCCSILARCLTDTSKLGSTSCRHIILRMKSRHVKKLYWAFLLITKVCFAFSSGYFCSAYQLSYFCDSFECIYTLLDFENGVIVFSTQGITYSFTYRGLSKTNDM